MTDEQWDQVVKRLNELGGVVAERPVRDTYIWPLPFRFGFRTGFISPDHLNGFMVLGEGSVWRKVRWRFYRRVS